MPVDLRVLYAVINEYELGLLTAQRLHALAQQGHDPPATSAGANNGDGRCGHALVSPELLNRGIVASPSAEMPSRRTTFSNVMAKMRMSSHSD